ncbi:MAG: LysR family transcriptional regulator [Verrucomicrobia bacterium]|nr:MAG: LysR family transcriptional regulator [Verrucomicrobiota bacterium]
MFEKLFSERGLSLERLRVLVEVHDAGSIAQAAPGDPIRQSQYSRQLRELAEFFGCEVASRKGKLLKLTSEGVRLAELARAQMRALDDFRADCAAETIDYTIAAGDSIIHWLVIPRLGAVLTAAPGLRFATANLRTGDIVQQLGDGRVDFGIIRRDALVKGLKSASLGVWHYALVVPSTLFSKKAKLTPAEVLGGLPIAAQTTDGQFAERLRALSHDLGVAPRHALACQSFPQTLAAVRSGDFAAVLPVLATADLPTKGFHQIAGAPLRTLSRELVLAWNPRLVRVRPAAGKLLAKLSAAFQL